MPFIGVLLSRWLGSRFRRQRRHQALQRATANRSRTRRPRIRSVGWPSVLILNDPVGTNAARSGEQRNRRGRERRVRGRLAGAAISSLAFFFAGTRKSGMQFLPGT
jgi:hypothetical protein